MNGGILIVEDDPVISQLIGWRLEKMGFFVSGKTQTAEEALDKIKDGRPDLILIDINLPGTMDGTELARRIKEQFQIPFIFLTAYTDSETISRAIDTEPAGYLIKPFKDEELKVMIELALRHAKKG
ncbi:MAG: response regulator [Methanolinea sp.]|jgi:DNA-binding response OmpR family regulator|nr:response regulator [Methanolinea sp.]